MTKMLNPAMKVLIRSDHASHPSRAGFSIFKPGPSCSRARFRIWWSESQFNHHTLDSYRLALLLHIRVYE
ncbi:NDR1/HIN1-like protein 13 [Iris pallida]|uniref:NDR1/HIN1-like protein 13 n=1 Tax=Iris pallida TaxID=29817 RepID=A0AAX6FVY6_IRIPA|nr:NDR1/HIN1-like protein 13 [Iris pallida]KAJ6853831.1 NDR1/HIN1-like protein 13 [Iris pallida]